jgi:hypothetical protein
MALARCEDCGVPDGRTKTYSGKRYFPIGFPQSGVICGKPRCENSAIVWLTFEEENQYEKGLRIFTMASNTAKVKIQDRKVMPSDSQTSKDQL